MRTDSSSPFSKNARSWRRQFSISSHVIPGLIAAVDSIVILSSALISSVLVVHAGDVSYYAAATAFVWLATILLMNFAGLYEFEAITRPVAYADKIIIVFATTFLFLLAAAFALKVSNEYSRIWTGSFAVSACVATLIFRVFAAQAIGYLADRQVFSRNVILVGSGEQMRKLLEKIERSRPRFITLRGVFAECREQFADRCA